MNTVFLATNDNAKTVSFLSDSEGEKHTLAEQPSILQPVGICSGK